MTPRLSVPWLVDPQCCAEGGRPSTIASCCEDGLTITFEGSLLDDVSRQRRLRCAAITVSRRWPRIRLDAWHFVAYEVVSPRDVFIAMAFPLGRCVHATSVHALICRLHASFVPDPC